MLNKHCFPSLLQEGPFPVLYWAQLKKKKKNQDGALSSIVDWSLPGQTSWLILFLFPSWHLHLIYFIPFCWNEPPSQAPSGRERCVLFYIPEGPELPANPLQEPLAAWVIGSKEGFYVKRKINVPPHLGGCFDGKPHTRQHFFFFSKWYETIKIKIGLPPTQGPGADDLFFSG